RLNMDKKTASYASSLCGHRPPTLPAPTPGPAPINREIYAACADSSNVIAEDCSELVRQKWVRKLGIPDESQWPRIREEICQAQRFESRTHQRRDMEMRLLTGEVLPEPRSSACYHSSTRFENAR
ncbi:MAG: hypothetical protein WC464_09320, partial [Bdellovibrionales bacterium]